MTTKDMASNLSSLLSNAAQRSARHQSLVEEIKNLASTVNEDSALSFPGSPVGGPPATAVARAVSPSESSDSHGFNKNFHSALEKLIAASGGKLSIKSGYRSPERQAQLWADALKKYGNAETARKWVAPPGKSNHNRGLAADLGFSDSAAINWAHQNAAKYGLIFPLSNENWHIEPIGLRGKK